MKLGAFLAGALREALESDNWRRWIRVDHWPLTFLDRRGKRLQGIVRVELSVHSIQEHPNQDASPEDPPKAVDFD